MAQPVSSGGDLLLDHEGPWTEEDYLALPEDNRRIELVDGGLLVSPYAGRSHQRLSFRIAIALDAAAPAGFEVQETVNVHIGRGRILIPDIVVVTDPGADDVMVEAAHVAMIGEIVSRGSVAADRAIKPPLYAAAGIPHYLRVESGGIGTFAVAYRLQEGRYVEVARGERLELAEPFPVTLDLPDLARRTRP